MGVWNHRKCGEDEDNAGNDDNATEVAPANLYVDEVDTADDDHADGGDRNYGYGDWKE